MGLFRATGQYSNFLGGIPVLGKKPKMLKIPKRIISIRESKKDRQHNGQQKKRPKCTQLSTKHYTEN